MAAFTAVRLTTVVAGQSGSTPLPSQSPNYLMQTFHGDPLLREVGAVAPKDRAPLLRHCPLIIPAKFVDAKSPLRDGELT